jgi:hypothetical protein
VPGGTLVGPAGGGLLSPDGRTRARLRPVPGGEFAAADLVVTDAATGKELWRVRCAPFAKEPNTNPCFSADGKQVAYVNLEGFYQRADAQTGAPRPTYPNGRPRVHPAFRKAGRDSPSDAFDAVLKPVVFSPDFRHLVGFDVKAGLVRLLDWATGAEVRVLRGPKGGKGEWQVRFLDGGALAASGGGETWVWDLAAAGPAHRFPGDLLDACPGGQTLLLWDKRGLAFRCRRGGHLVRRLAEEDGRGALSPDGRLLIRLERGGLTLKDFVTERAVVRLPAGRVGEDVSEVVVSPGGRYLATASEGGVVTVWDVARLTDRQGLPAAPPSPAEVERLWPHLGSEDPAVAYRAVWRLATAPEAAVALARKRLAPARPPEGVEGLVADLDSAKFGQRERAARRLRELDGALPRLRRLAGEGPLERGRRLEGIVRDLEQLRLTAAQRQAYRAVQLLEHIATSAARELLRELARGDAEALLTRQAEGAVRRLSRPQQAGPARR